MPARGAAGSRKTLPDRAQTLLGGNTKGSAQGPHPTAQLRQTSCTSSRREEGTQAGRALLSRWAQLGLRRPCRFVQTVTPGHRAVRLCSPPSALPTHSRRKSRHVATRGGHYCASTGRALAHTTVLGDPKVASFASSTECRVLLALVSGRELWLGVCAPEPRAEIWSPVWEAGPSGRCRFLRNGWDHPRCCQRALALSSRDSWLSERAGHVPLGLLSGQVISARAGSTSPSHTSGRSLQPQQRRMLVTCFLYGLQNWEPRKPLFFTHYRVSGILQQHKQSKTRSNPASARHRHPRPAQNRVSL